MTNIELHEKAMNHSFLAKQAREMGDEDGALYNYEIAAEFETQAANYYLDKHDLEPTRSILIRSAAILNLKSGRFENAEKFIFHGLINIDDELIKGQLYEALELCLAFKDLGGKEAGINVDYIYKMRQRSVLYYISPKSGDFSSAVSLDMISDFSNYYTKSLNAYSRSKYVDYFATKHKETSQLVSAAESFQESVKPVITNASFGSFKFALATDYLVRVGEQKEITTLKSNILLKYHEEIFTQELSDENIEGFKEEFTDDEIDEIFRPLTHLKANNREYKIGFYNRETFKKEEIKPILSKEKAKLLPIKTISKEDIGKLESTISHKRETNTGSQSRSIILRQEMKTGSFDYPISIIEPKGESKIILNNQIIINVYFDSEKGFNLSFSDLGIESNSNSFDDALGQFHYAFLQLVREVKIDKILREENKFWRVITHLINNPDAIE